MDKFIADKLNAEAKKLFEGPYGAAHDGAPNHAGWALAYIEAERPVPESWRNRFYDELFTDNEEYRKKLEESVRWFGVRWAKS